MTKNIKSIKTERLGSLCRVVVNGEQLGLILYASGAEKIAKLIGELTGVEPELEPKRGKKDAKPTTKAKDATKSAKTKKGKKSKPVSETSEPESEDPPRVVAEQV